MTDCERKSARPTNAISVVGALLICLHCFGSPPVGASERKLAKGIEWLVKEDFEKSINSLRAAKKEAESAPLLHLASAYAKRERSGEAPEIAELERKAVGALREILKAFHGSPSPLMNQARILLCRLRPWETEASPKEGPIHVGGDVHKPEKIYTPRPPHTPLARRAGIQGVVIAQVIITQEGCVQHVKILKGLPMGLSGAAVETLANWVFAPAHLNTRPVASYYNLTVNFRLQ